MSWFSTTKIEGRWEYPTLTPLWSQQLNPIYLTFLNFSSLFLFHFQQEEEHQLGSTATDNQKEGAMAIAIATTTAPPTTSNWSDLLNKEQNPTYLEQMKETENGKEKQDKKKRSNPLSTTATPERTIKVTPSKSMKYYEVSRENLQAIMYLPCYLHYLEIYALFLLYSSKI